MGGSYVIEGVDFLPAQAMQLSAGHPVRSVFLGYSGMTLARFDDFPGRSPGYAKLPPDTRAQFAQDIPRWSEFVRQEAARYDCPYVDVSDDFHARLREAKAMLLGEGRQVY